MISIEGNETNVVFLNDSGAKKNNNYIHIYTLIMKFLLNQNLGI